MIGGILILDELWKDIVGYEGLYKISNTGRVIGCAKQSGWYFREEKELQVHDNGKKYLYVDLYNNEHKRRKQYIHRLVAEAFIPNPDNLPEINHKDENRHNNFYDNLEWCTRKYNINYGTRNLKHSVARKGKYTGKDSWNSKKVICLTTGDIFDSVKEASEFYNIPNVRSFISRYCKGTIPDHYAGKLKDGTKLTWMYYDEYLSKSL